MHQSLLAVALIWLSFHLWNGPRLWLRLPQASDPTIDEEMDKLRKDTFLPRGPKRLAANSSNKGGSKEKREMFPPRFVSCGLAHFDFVFGMYALYEAFATPSMATTAVAICCSLSYLQFLSIAKGWLSLTPERLVRIACVTHLMPFTMCLMPILDGDQELFYIRQGFFTASRLALIGFLQPKITIPFQILYTLAESMAYFYISSSNDMGAWCTWQGFALAEMVAVSLFIDITVRARIQAHLQAEDAETLVSSFRKLLRGVCDGEVLLDDRCRVREESSCLKHLILTDVSLKGKAFEDLLADEQARFREFIAASTTTNEHPTSPVGLRVSLRDSAGIRVGADIYHVPVPGHSHEPYHLLAFKEDPESRLPPDADTVDQFVYTGASLHQSYGPTGGSTNFPMSSIQSSVEYEKCPELSHATLLLDLHTELQDVLEMHLKFERTEESDVFSALQTTMPSARKLLRPSDWEKFGPKMADFAVRSRSDSELQPQALGKLHIHLLGAWTVALATLRRCEAAGKVWLTLHDFEAPESPRKRGK